MASTILIVDDSGTMRAIIKTYLGSLGSEIAEAATVDEALALATARPVDVLITDVWLGEKSGLDLAEALRRRPGGEALGVVFISSDTTAALRERAQALGAEAFFTKPFGRSALLQVVSTLAARPARSG